MAYGGSRCRTELREQWASRYFGPHGQGSYDDTNPGNNGSIGDPDEGWAHAAVLVQYLNLRRQLQADGK